MNPSYAKYLIEKTKDYFDKNVDSFSGSRNRLWPEFEELKKYMKGGEKILDLGCGNGRLFELFKNRNVKYTGVDTSVEFIERAKEKYGDYFVVADAFNLPFSDNSFDSIWAIAFFHHIPSKHLRLKILKEIKRVLKKDGKIIATCWNFYQLHYLRILLKFTFRKLFGLSRLDFKDVLLSPKKLKIQRYYHAFTKKELKKLFQKAGFKIEELRYLKRNGKKTNILIVATKI
jgi:ubiquinone/menaquinone biosynthesis C-methylase UbiE